ncbi:DUF418 domain-containing protein [Hymenobacter coccineus]|uniref:DUF418 domain-containing protein n=1 Tax=Hymenobacter coccineus TaxID=1908235 RepID=UPI000A516615|nr:DUF418 domain-containing protein [Hymenobacter coccineus]
MTPSLPDPAKQAKAARLQTVDALRGGALLGILVVHCSRWFAPDALPSQLYATHAAGYLNGLVTGKVELLFVDKFYALFSFLFGLSFSLMISRSHVAPAAFFRRFLRRLCILGAIGLLHYLHWRGDILLIYAVLGALLLLFNRFSNGVVLAFALVLALNLPVRSLQAYRAWTAPPPTAQPAARAPNPQAQATYRTLAHGSYAATVWANAHSFGDALDFQFGSGRIFQTLGFFLLGLYTGRRRLFERLESARGAFWWFVGGALLLLVATKLLALAMGRAHEGAQLSGPLAGALLAVVRDLGNVATTGFYIAGLALLFQSRPGRWVATPLALVGRMALTNYLLQTLIGSLVFFGYGLGLLRTSELWLACLLSLPIFLLQVGASAYWLKHFTYGPVEWLWRSLTLGERQSLRLKAKTA